MTADLTVTLGSLNLCDSPFGLEFGMDVGAPQNTVEALAFLLQDGEIELSSRASNRQFQFNVLVEGANLTALAEAEASLVAESEKALNTLTVDPGDSAPATVFDTYRAQVVLLRDDEYERNGFRAYQVTVRAMPFGRSETEVVTEATGSGTMTVPPTITSTTVDDGSSTTGWTGAWARNRTGPGSPSTSGSATPSVVSGTVQVVSDAETRDLGGAVYTETVEATRTGSVDTSTTKQLVISWKWDSVGDQGETWTATNFRVQVNGSTYLTQLSGTTTPARASLTEAVFQVPSSISTVTSIRVILDAQGIVRSGQTRSLAIDDISRNNANASVSTPRQLQRVIDVAGTARTPGRLTIEHETSALGDVLAYFWPDTTQSYTPAMRQFRTSGGAVTADTTLVSGARENLVGNTVTFTVPASRVPSDLHNLMARLGGANTTATISWTVTTVINGVDTGPILSGSRSLPITTAYQILPLGRVNLPTRNVSSSSSTAQVRFTLTATVSSGSTANLDEGWFFARMGQLVQIACGTATPSSGGSSNRLWLDPATATEPQPSLKIGYLADGSDAAFPLTDFSWQFPEFVPERTNVFTVTTNALDAAVTLRNFPRWHTSAAS